MHCIYIYVCVTIIYIYVCVWVRVSLYISNVCTCKHPYNDPHQPIAPRSRH
jgi:uncharacterized SAM-binding protein YcdF (DUF218 family)